MKFTFFICFFSLPSSAPYCRHYLFSLSLPISIRAWCATVIDHRWPNESESINNICEFSLFLACEKIWSVGRRRWRQRDEIETQTANDNNKGEPEQLRVTFEFRFLREMKNILRKNSISLMSHTRHIWKLVFLSHADHWLEWVWRFGRLFSSFDEQHFDFI